MPTFSQGDVVRVPFPYTDRNTRRRRPALVISDGAVGPERTLLWVAMITSAASRPWPQDCPITNYATGGLPIASVVRPAKITTLEARDAEIIGAVDKATCEKALAAVRAILGG